MNQKRFDVFYNNMYIYIYIIVIFVELYMRRNDIVIFERGKVVISEEWL